MKTKLLKSLNALLLLILLLGCRNENLYSSDDSEKQKDEFFAKLSQSLSNNPDGKKIIERIRNENLKTNFLAKINKRNEEAKLDKKILQKSFQLDKAGKSEDSIVYLNIPFGNSKNLTSVLFIEFTSSEFRAKEIDNIKLEEIAYNETLSREYREQLLINYLILDQSQYNTLEYINIPSTLFPELKENTTTSSKSFKIKNYSITTSESTGGRIGDTIVCIEYEDSCDHCSGLPTHWMCYTLGGGGYDPDTDTGGGTGTGTGNTGNNDGGGGDGGDGSGNGNNDPENPDPCTDPNSPWYTHSSCGNNFPNAVMTLSQKMDNYGFDISAYLQYLTSNPSIRTGFATYLGNHTNQQGAAFVMWGLGFLSQNPSMTWTQFENYVNNNKIGTNIETGDFNNNTSGNYDENLFENFDFENQQIQWPTISNVLSLADFVGWNRTLYPNWQCMDYAKAQIGKKGYKVSNYYDVDSQGNKQTFQIYTEQNGVNLNDLYKGISYLKYALSKGIPVIVGIDDQKGHPGNLDKSTDHFVVIVGMGTDSKGRFFRFFDNASGLDPQNQGASSENKLYVKYPERILTGRTLCSGYRDSETEYDYIVTMIRKSK